VNQIVNTKNCVRKETLGWLKGYLDGSVKAALLGKIKDAECIDIGEQQEPMVLQPSIARAIGQLDQRLQLGNTPPSNQPHAVNIHQMAPPERDSRHPITAYYSFIDLEKDERLSLPTLLICSRRFTHISGRAQDRESHRPKTDVLPLCHKNALSK